MGLRALTERLTGTHIYRVLPHGVDVFHDIATSLPAFDATTVFDVGANMGQSARLYLNKFPRAHVYCFEPVATTFSELENRLGENSRISCHRLALGASMRLGQMVLQGTSDRHFLLRDPKGISELVAVPVEPVAVTTVDEFCLQHHVDRIGYLKIDTEGSDLDVLRGAEEMLESQSIDFLQVEAGMNPLNNFHVSLEKIKAYLENRRYYLFGIYEQVLEWPTHSPYLRRSNSVFVSSRLIANADAYRDFARH